MNPKDYPNIIFDFGGVILNLDYQRTIAAFQELGINDFEQSYSQLNQTDLFDRFERGEISPAAFRNGLRTVFKDSILDEELDSAWNAMLLDLPAKRLTVLEKLRAEKRISLLSNTNEIHIEAFESSLKQTHGLEDLSGFFDHVYYSCRTGMRKPEARIFEMVLKEQNYKPEETLFIDDSPQHIEGARKVGLNVYHLRADQGETILDLF
ncbi:MAG: HAD-IA family hydrolase [Flavobacteriales bacterium]|nr:HAD-IA family hydrolase [Flavobacteriales bacterium]